MLYRANGLAASLIAFGILSAPRTTQAMTIVLNPNATLAANTAALSAFQRAADQWGSRLSDPITVTIDAGLDATLNANIIGSTNSVILQGAYHEIRDQMVADSLFDSDDTINHSLPTAAQFTATMPAGRSLTGDMIATKANLKAMGFTDLDSVFGASDAQIDFNPAFDFDYDNRDGTNLGAIDFETAAAHEIGHALGFVSIVDTVNDGGLDVAPTPLDLYRFRADQAPSTASAFATASRDLTPGHDDVFADTGSVFRFSSGVTTIEFPTTDGRQASHWKDDAISGSLIGIMDPTLAPGNFFGVPFVETLSYADLRAMDLIGYDFVVPEPMAIGLLAAAIPLLNRRRRA